jgi:hypothetical protein
MTKFTMLALSLGLFACMVLGSKLTWSASIVNEQRHFEIRKEMMLLVVFAD